MKRLLLLERSQDSSFPLAICGQGRRGAFSSACVNASVRWLVLVLVATVSAFANTFTSADITGFGTNTVAATAVAFYFGSNSGDPPSIEAFEHANGRTDGPIRWGIIELTAFGGGEFGGGSADVDGYSFGCEVGCHPLGFVDGLPFPFLLGVPFQVNVEAFASDLGMGSGDMSFQFSLFEAVSVPGFAAPIPGAKVTIFDPPDPPADVPEPATFASFSLGLLSLAVVHPALRGKYRKSIGPAPKR